MSTTTTEPTTAPSLPALDDETRAVLAKAKGIVANGWWQPGRCDLAATGQCVTFAIAEAIGFAKRIGEGRATDPYCRALGFDDYVEARRWNDTPGRTQAEVVALFDKALGA